jgi:SNF2 family DNA or RNA helicase
MDNNIPDLHALMSSCATVPPYPKFCSTFSNPTWDGFKTVYRGVRNEEKLKKFYAKFLLRRKKAEVLPELPEKTIVRHDVDVGAALAKKSKEYVNYVIGVLENGVGEGEIEKVAYVKVRQELGIAKIKGCVEYYNMLLEGGSRPLVIGAYHRDVVKGIYTELENLGWKVARGMGGDSPKHKQKLNDDFQGGKLDACVVNIISMGIGINLHAANHICLAEVTTVPSQVIQFMDRVHRIGQTRGVIVHVALAKGSLDVGVWNTYKGKLRDIGKVFE